MCTGIEKTFVNNCPQKGKILGYTHCIMANNPSPMTYTGTNTWILCNASSRGAYIVDPGPLLEDHLEAIKTYLESAQLKPRAILLTHMHHDHSEAAPELASQLGLNVYSRSAGNLDDGSFAVNDGPKLSVISLPGHSSDSVGFCFLEDSSIITGDVLFVQSPTTIVLPDGNLKDYFQTLAVLRDLVEKKSFSHFLSSHGPIIDDPIKVITETENHRLHRLKQVKEAIAHSGKVDIENILEYVYDDVDVRLDPAARMNVIAQLDYLKSTNDPSLSS